MHQRNKSKKNQRHVHINLQTKHTNLLHNPSPSCICFYPPSVDKNMFQCKNNTPQKNKNNSHRPNSEPFTNLFPPPTISPASARTPGLVPRHEHRCGRRGANRILLLRVLEARELHLRRLKPAVATEKPTVGAVRGIGFWVLQMIPKHYYFDKRGVKPSQSWFFHLSYIWVITWSYGITHISKHFEPFTSFHLPKAP